MIRIGGASGYWGETPSAAQQLLQAGDLDYLVFDYLAEITMSIMARARQRNPELGYATDFIKPVMSTNLRTIAEQGVKVLSNAGGVNPHACGKALRALIAEQGLDLKVAVVSGDDVLPYLGSTQDDLRDIYSGEKAPQHDKILSANAYLGAFPIVEALEKGADIVVTGRCVDSAVTLAACIYEYGWKPDQLDLLAQGSLIGHLLECGPQVTGGNFTDWHQIADSIADIGYPIAEVEADGNCIITKPAGTGGIVSVGTVSEQMLYEIGDPQAYMLPDVVCDFSEVSIQQQAADRVAVQGAIGRGIPPTLKVSATFSDGWRGGTQMTFYGPRAADKAKAFASAAFERAKKRLSSTNLGDFDATDVEVLGAEAHYGERGRQDSREVVIKVAVRHQRPEGIGILLREMAGLGLATPPGLCGFAGSRAKPSERVRLLSLLLPKGKIQPTIDFGSGETACRPWFAGGEQGTAQAAPLPQPPNPDDLTHTVDLEQLAWLRSGDKGDKANVGVIARKQHYLQYIVASLSDSQLKRVFHHLVEGEIEIYHLPGSHAINLLMDQALGGGGIASLRSDPQGKGFGQLMADLPVAVPSDIAAECSGAVK